jgi:hypothetical protein
VDPLVTLANVLFVAAYFVRNMLWLRAFALGGASCLALYFYTLPTPLMLVVYWNLFYVTLNVLWIARLLLAREDAEGRSGSAPASR